MSFSIRQLRYFVAVAEAGQISSAARGLYVSQSSVTMAVQEMERLLSQRLFTRGSRGVELTPTGSEFLPKARQILRLVDEAALVTATDTDPHGRLRVGVTYTVMAYFLPHQIQRLTIAFPNIDFSWLEMGRPDVEERLACGDLDFGLVLTSNLQSPELEHQTYVHSQRRLWLAPDHPLSRLGEIGLADVAEHPYVQLTVDEADVTTRLYWGDLTRRILMETSSIEPSAASSPTGTGWRSCPTWSTAPGRSRASGSTR